MPGSLLDALNAIGLQGLMPPAAAPFANPTSLDSYRPDGSMKGRGFLGPLTNRSGQTMTEYSIGVNIGGKEIEIPTLVPTLTPQELNSILTGGKISDEIVRKAVDHARGRMQQGLSPFLE